MEWELRALGLVAILSVFLLLLRFFVLRQAKTPSMKFSLASVLAQSSQGWKQKWAHLPEICFFVALTFFGLALLRPEWRMSQSHSSSHTPPPVEGIAIYLLLDRSGSMNEEVPAPSVYKDRVSIPKIELLKEVTESFVKHEKNSLIGLIAFARGAQVLSPLTLDHEAVLNQLKNFRTVNDRSQDGTAIGYAIYKAASLISATRHFAESLNQERENKNAYRILEGTIVLVTDGFQDPNPLDKGKKLRNTDIPDAARYAKEQNVRLYVVNVDPKMALDEYAPHRRQMEQSTALTGGKFYLVDQSRDLIAIYSDIERLEKSRLPQQVVSRLEHTEKTPFYPILIFGGLLLLLIGMILRNTWLRRIP